MTTTLATGMHPPKDDTVPMTRGQHGFTALLEQHRGIVLKVAGTYARDPDDRADLAQEIAAQLWRAWPRYDPARRFSTWMYRIALNVAIDFVRGNTRRIQHSVPLDEALDDAAGVAADCNQESQAALRTLQRLIASLDPLNRALLLLYMEDCSTREIAEILGLGESNVTTRISRLKQRLREQIAAG
jgi:RNA polymerase sigma factor (sigma-70 family)